MTSTWIHIWIPTTSHETSIRDEAKLNQSFIQETQNNIKYEECAINPQSNEETKSCHKKVFLVTKTNAEDNLLVNNGDNADATGSPEPLVKFTSFEESLDDLFKLINIIQYTCVYSNDRKFKLVSLICSGSEVEELLIQLKNRGIGVDELTDVSVVPTSIHISGSAAKKSDENNKMERFYNSVKSRLLVTEVVSRIRAGGKFTFDYVMLVLLAGAIAFMGLVENSSVVLVASMLVSPIMGPILAGIFGTVIQDYSLTKQGVRNELISLLLCVVIGLVGGLIISPLIYFGAYEVDEWPTSEMTSRGRLHSCYTGILIAIPSGAGVALSVLGGNAGSLVGVAISASLLPPAVNAGVFWAISLYLSIINDINHPALLKGHVSFTIFPK